MKDLKRIAQKVSDATGISLVKFKGVITGTLDHETRRKASVVEREGIGAREVIEVAQVVIQDARREFNGEMDAKLIALSRLLWEADEEDNTGGN